MRGERSLFNEMFGEEAQAHPGKQRPRNVLMPERNTLLLYRFYFMINIARMRYDDTLQQLEREFFIVQARIVVVLMQNEVQLHQIVKQEKPDLAILARLYPHINWKHRPQMS
jgi:hypothetical protein